MSVVTPKKGKFYLTPVLNPLGVLLFLYNFFGGTVFEKMSNLEFLPFTTLEKQQQ